MLAFRLTDSRAQTLDRQRILRPDIDKTFIGAHGVGADRHTLQDAVWIAFQHAAIHKRPGIALIRVTDDVLTVTIGLGDSGPLQTRRKPSSTAPAQATVNKVLSDL